MDVGFCTQRGRFIGGLYDSPDRHDCFGEDILPYSTGCHAPCKFIK